MKLEQIGFYTLTDNRAANASETSRLSRCELILTSKCNFRCPYCRQVGGSDLPYEDALNTVKLWAEQGLSAIRFSGGEPLLWKGLVNLVKASRGFGINRIAVSSNGSLPWAMYDELLDAGVNDLSISLDACCAEDGDKMAGGRKGSWSKVVDNIKRLSQKTYLTVGVVLTDENAHKINEIVRFADSLGVADIRVIPAAQDGDRLTQIVIDEDLLAKYPILKYRMGNVCSGRTVRGLSETDSKQCGLVLDDMAVCDNKHYPCIIYLREGGDAIGNVGSEMRAERAAWYANTNTHEEPICKANCLDVCVDYNNKFVELHK